MLTDVAIAKKFVEKHKRALKSDIEFTLTFAEYKRLMSRKTCAYTGIKFPEFGGEWDADEKWRSITVDRIDNKKGYIPGNVAAVCNGINSLKSQWEDPCNPVSMKVIIRMMKRIDSYMK